MSKTDAYKAKAEAQLAEWKAELDKLRAKAKGSSADGRLALQNQLDEMEAKLSQARAKLTASGAEAWDDIKGEVESAWGSAKGMFDEFKAKFK